MDNRSPFQRDFDRIIFSSALRRMQDKTQVFPLPKSDYVRTRLTHSLEVSSVGRSLGEMVGAGVIKRHPKLAQKNITQADFAAVVASACLAHDIGNPPFGHSGESAMQHWFRNEMKNGRASEYLLGLGAREAQDLQNFEGNAQGFRIISKLQNANQQEGGLQLTAATLATFLKYPRESSVPGEPKLPKGQSSKKLGFFQSEQPLVTRVASEVGLIQKKAKLQSWCRHPLAFLVEAADDICYRIIDLEDGFKLNLVPFADVEGLLRPLASVDPKKRLATIKGDKDKVEYLRTLAIRTLIPEVVQSFLDHEKGILAGTFDDDLVGKITSAAKLNAIHDYSIKRVYTAREVVEIEAAGFEVLGGLLGYFLPALHDVVKHGKQASHRNKKYVELLPPFVQNRLTPKISSYDTALCATDFVSGMTDSYAVSVFKGITGMSLPSA